MPYPFIPGFDAPISTQVPALVVDFEDLTFRQQTPQGGDDRVRFENSKEYKLRQLIELVIRIGRIGPMYSFCAGFLPPFFGR
jgi:hypothetical protein